MCNINNISDFLGLSVMSARMKCLKPDEFLTLAVLMDTDGDGIISWNDFFDFCTVCDKVISFMFLLLLPLCI